jgi:hypothetical protein
MKFMVLLLGNSFGPWSKLQQDGPLKTWCTKSGGELDWYVYSGRTPKFEVINRFLNRAIVSRFLINHWGKFQKKVDVNQIRFEVSNRKIEIDLFEIWSNITLKTLVALRYAHSHTDFDYILRTNATCYTNLPALVNFIQELDSKFVYGGPVASGKVFVSGWGVLISQEGSEVIFKKDNLEHLKMYDDEALGQILLSHGIKPTPIPFLEIQSYQELDGLSDEYLKTFPFIRVKSSENGMRTDDQIMSVIHERLKNSNNYN